MSDMRQFTATPTVEELEADLAAENKRIVEREKEIERLRAALEAVKGFCKYCGATYPHRYGEGRCEKCAAVKGKDDAATD